MSAPGPARFAYSGWQHGRKVSGELEAANLLQARLILQGEAIRKPRLKHLRKRGQSPDDALPFWQKKGPLARVPAKEMTLFTRKLASMARAGLPLVDALEMAGSQSASPVLRQACQQISMRLNEGARLADAFASQNKHFDAVYLNMLAAGELSGQLDIFLGRLAVMQEKQQTIRAGIRSALFYPIALIVITLSISWFMLTSVVPVFQEMFASLGAELPAPTRAIVAASEWIREPLHLLGLAGSAAAVILAVRFAFARLYPLRKGRSWLALRLPVISQIVQKAAVARLALLLANLLSAGVAVLEALEVCTRLNSNLLMREAMQRITLEAASGAPLSDLFARESVFPPALAQLMAVGEKTGNMDEMLGAIARYYEEEFDALISGLATIIEPLMIVFVGAMIGALVVALYLPIFSAGDAFSGAGR